MSDAPLSAAETAALARRMVSLLDLTDLSESATEASTLQLCAKAKGAPESGGLGPCAAVCLWPQFVSIARRALAGSPVKIATVINFPAGGTHVTRIVGDIAEALDDGADEIDLVLPWKAFLAGDRDVAQEMVSEARAAAGSALLKVILESGAFPDQSLLRQAGELAIAGGADFLKTSTGKTEAGATLEAARTLLDVIKEAARPVGLKVSGGVRSLAEARGYLELAEARMGRDWVTPARFRFGASSLHAALAAASAGLDPANRGDGAY